MKKPSVKKLKENPSTERLVSSAKLSRWHRLKSKCPKCFRKTSGTHPIPISTITKSEPVSREHVHSVRNSHGRKLFDCICCKCKKSKKGELSFNAAERSSTSTFRCQRLRNNFKNTFNKLKCCKKKGSNFSATDTPKMDAEIACVGAQEFGTKASSFRERCSSKFFKCWGLLCCVNSAFCINMRDKCGSLCSCCKKCVCCGKRKKKTITEAERRKSTISVPKRRKWTRVCTDFPKLDSSYVEHGSVMRGAIPMLPVPLAWFCLILNVFLPGFGTLSSGIFCLFIGKPRFSINDSILARIGAFLVNLLVATSQLFTVLFCLVGWGWSIWWGVIMLKMAKKNKRMFTAEQGTNSANLSPVAAQNRDLERGTI